MTRVKPRRAASTLARGWLRDGRGWALGASLVLAGTIIAMLGTSGLLAGTHDATIGRVADFYTGDLRITPVRAGAIPSGWFDRNATAAAFKGAGATVSLRVEAQYIMSRQGLIANVIDTYAQNGQFPVETPGQSGEDANRTLAVGGLIGLEANDASAQRIAQYLVAGRMPRVTSDGTMEVAMSITRLRGFLTPDERRALPDPPPLSALCHRDSFVRSTPCEITSAQTAQTPGFHDFVRRPVDIVGLFDTGVDVLDTFTLVAAAQPVRELLGHGANEGIVNAIAVESGAAPAQSTAQQHHWATQDADAFAGTYVGQLMAVLSAFAVVVGALLFLLPTFLVSNGIARQLALQQRELAVCTAIGVPARILRMALALQVLRIAAIGAAISGAVLLLCAWILPPILHGVHGTPLPVSFSLGLVTVLMAAGVTALAMLIGWALGMRSRSRLPMVAQLRAG